MPKLNFQFALHLHRGGHCTPQASLELMEAAGCCPGRGLQNILMKADYGLGPYQLLAVLLTNHALGFTDSAMECQTQKAGLEHGLCLLPHWAMAAMCIACQQKPIGPRVLLASEGIQEELGRPPWQFGIDQQDLYLSHALPQGYWGSQKLFLFGIPNA